jgi:metallo-beta-lactamase family protein
MRVRAEIASLDELSAHADYRELIEWIKPLVPSLRKVFLVHGEPEQSAAFSKLLVSTYGLDVVVPAPGQSFWVN